MKRKEPPEQNIAKIKKQKNETIVPLPKPQTQRKHRRSNIEMYKNWYTSFLETNEQKTEQLNLKLCETCQVVHSSQTPHNCNSATQLSLQKQIIAAKIPGLPLLKQFEGINITSSSSTKTNVIKKCLDSTLNNKYKIKFKQHLENLVQQNHQAIFLASRLLNYHLLLHPTIENFDGPIIKQAISAICFFHHKSSEINDIKETKEELEIKEDQIINNDIFNTYKNYFSKCFAKEFKKPCGDLLSSTAHRDAACLLQTNFENYYQSTFWKRLYKWIQMTISANPLFQNLPKKSKILYKSSSIVQQIITSEEMKINLKLIENINEKLKDDTKNKERISDDQKKVLINLIHQMELEFSPQYYKYLKETKMSSSEKQKLKLTFSSRERHLVFWMKKMLEDFDKEREKRLATSSSSEEIINKHQLKIPKSYSLFPIIKFIPPHLMIDQRLMLMLYEKCTSKKRTSNEDTRWQNELFQLKLNEKNKKKFWRNWTRCLSDGVSICFSLTTLDLQGSKKIYKEINIIKQNGKRYISIDTNRANFFVAAERKQDVGEQKEEQKVLDIKDVKKLPKDPSFILSQKEWKYIRGIPQARKIREKRLNQPKYQDIQPLLNNPLMSCKGASLEMMKNHLCFLNLHMERFKEFYYQRCHRREKMHAYIKEQRAWTYVRDKLKLSSQKDREDTVVIIGDGKFNCSSIGHDPLPGGNKLHHHLKRLGARVVWQNEFRTSKLCSCCKSEVKEICKSNSRYNVQDSFRIRLCSNKECGILWNRDVNACVNMLDLYLEVTYKPGLERMKQGFKLDE